jgi:multidrug efflux system outer membrane protein
VSRRATFASTLAITLAAAACSAPPKICRDAEAGRLRTTMAERTDELGLGPDRVLTLAECEEIALRNNLDYRVRTLETQLADADVKEALTHLLPRASAEFTKTARSNDPAITGPAGGVGEFEDRKMERFRTGALIPIFDFGATQFAWEIAKDQRDQKRLTLERARQTLIRDVRVAYARLAGVLDEADLAASQVDAAREELRVARSLEREGLAAGADTAFVDASLARAELALTEVGRDVMLARTTLARTLSLPTWTEFRIVREPAAKPEPPTSKEAVLALEQIALLSRPELVSQDLERHIAASELRTRFAEFFPRLGGTVDYEWSSNSLLVNPSFVKGGIVVASSLLDSGATIIRYRKAQGQELVEQERALLVGMSVLYEVDFRILELARALDGIAAAEKVVAAQESLLKSVRSRHREGLESGAVLTRALAEWNVARRGLNDRRTESAAAWFELLAAIGVERLGPDAGSRPASMPAAESAPVKETP